MAGDITNHVTPCPSCGHCPTCGRRPNYTPIYPFAPTYPGGWGYIPLAPSYPTWPTITFAATGANIGGDPYGTNVCSGGMTTMLVNSAAGNYQ